MYQPSYYQIYIKVVIETDLVMTLICELFQSECSVLSGRLIKSMFPLHIRRPNYYTKEIIVLLSIQFYNIFTNVLSNIFKRFTNILKIYELPKTYNKILKKLLTMSSPRSVPCHNFIWHLKFIENVRLGQETLLALN